MRVYANVAVCMLKSSTRFWQYVVSYVGYIVYSDPLVGDLLQGEKKTRRLTGRKRLWRET